MSALFDLSRPRRVHVVGVGGPGMSAVALCLADMGNHVSGSDVREVPVMDTLRSRGVMVHIGHDPELVRGVDAVTYSTAVPLANVEIVAARDAAVEVMHRAGMLAAICARAEAIGVAGTHGKTTTSAMLLAILSKAGIDPSYIIGAEVLATGTGARWTGSTCMIIEADESDGTHAALPLHGSIITNLDLDHLDHYGTMEGLRESFREYASRIKGPIVLSGDNIETRTLAERLSSDPSVTASVMTYGSSPSSDALVVAVSDSPDGTSFRLHIQERDIEVNLPTFGLHNVHNAAAAITMASMLGVDPSTGADALGAFGGVERRFQLRGVARGSSLVDDYAHLPAEIEAALGAARQRFPRKKIIAVFQPNRFHRIQAMAGEYAGCFRQADHVAITDVYASGTTRIEGVTGRLVVEAVVDRGGHRSVGWCETREELIRYVSALLGEDTVCVSMGCGDIERFPDELVAHLGGESGPKR